MAESLYYVRCRIRSTRNAIRNKKQYIRQKNRRLEDIDEAISSFYRVNNCIMDINGPLYNGFSCLKCAVAVDGKCAVSTDSTSLKEKSTNSDYRISVAIDKLNKERNVVRNEIISATNELNSLNYRLEELKDEERRLVNKKIFGGD